MGKELDALTRPLVSTLSAADPHETTRIAVAAQTTAVPPDVFVPESYPAPPGLRTAYRLAETLGHGASGRVYRGQHPALGVPVAVKVFAVPTPAAADEVARAARTEAITLARLYHPGVVRLWDFGVCDDVPYLVTEYVAGGSLGDLIRLAGRLDWRKAFAVGRQVAAALGAAAREGITHRDVKPDNVLVGPDGTAKLIDFGLAVLRGGRALYRTPSSRRAALAGTGAYMAPEQARECGRADHRADMYSLGATLYHAVTGRTPFAAVTPAQMLLRHVHDPAPAAHLAAPGLGLAESGLIARLLAKNPDERFAGYDDLTRALDQLLAP